jgi:hypothetical protein
MLINLHDKKKPKEPSDGRFNSIDIPELIGLCKGVLADGTINLEEAKFIQRWLLDRSDVLTTWPADVLHTLLGKVLEDGQLSDSEEAELVELLEEISGEPVSVMFL